MAYRLTPEQTANMEPGDCLTCGRHEPTGRNTAGQCTDCHNEQYFRAQARRKAELAELPRCECDGCKRRGTWRASGVLLCGRHLKRAQGKLAGMGIIGALCAPTADRETILSLAKD